MYNKYLQEFAWALSICTISSVWLLGAGERKGKRDGILLTCLETVGYEPSSAYPAKFLKHLRPQ